MSQPAWVVAGPSGSGKSTLGLLLSSRLGVPFHDADDHHPPANRAKMTAGIPLDDADRAPWLDALAALLASGHASGLPPVLACSALRRRYRDRLRAALPRGGVRFVMLAPPRETLAARLAARRDHFFPPALLDSQLAALELPAAGEEPDCIILTADEPPGSLLAAIAVWQPLAQAPRNAGISPVPT